MSSSTHTENTTPTLQDQHLDTDKCPSCMTSVAGGRRLVVAFDGTENQFGLLSSHVLEFHSRIVQNDDQISHYNSGIGTFVKPSSFTRLLPVWIKNKWAAAVAPNFNFDSNLLSGYRFLSEKYQKGDRIFLVGESFLHRQRFSRGAYQARVLAAMIARVGLLRAGSDELIPFCYTNGQKSGEPDGPKTTIAEEFKEAFCNDVKIHFVGVWDTVSSVGLFRNKYYPGAELAEGICFFRHALAIDERRVKFIPEYIVASSKDFLPGELGEPRCKEVWFRGYHSDIGGGNKENITRDNGAIPSRWMVYEAKLAGLKMTKFPRSKESALKPGPDSMTQLYKVLEYADPLVRIIKWEIHSKDRPPLLDDEGKPPPRVFTRSVTSFSLVSIICLNMATKNLSSRTSQADL
ncbi:hypothetical protein EI94DRAFT_1904090 [Lactarius quietus]|nr:hypothetical protein EI94DRAFT_1904090 [Lactarius quietus]